MRSLVPFAVFAVGLWSASAQDLKPEDIFKTVGPSVVSLQVEKSDGTFGTGTGFLAIQDGIVVTAWHVVSRAKSVTARFSSGEVFEVSGLIDRDEIRDVALLRIKVAGRPRLPLQQGDPEVGSKVLLIGSPRGYEFSITDGLVSQVRQVDGVKQIQFSCPASPGNSGGPLLSLKGEVLGVVSWQRNDAQNLSFAVSASYVAGLDHSLGTKRWEEIQASPSVNNVTQIDSNWGLSAEADFHAEYVVGSQDQPVYVMKPGHLLSPNSLRATYVPSKTPLHEVIVDPGKGQFRVLTDGSVLFSKADSKQRVLIEYKGKSRRAAVLPPVNLGDLSYMAEAGYQGAASALKDLGFDVILEQEVRAAVRELRVNVDAIMTRKSVDANDRILVRQVATALRTHYVALVLVDSGEARTDLGDRQPVAGVGLLLFDGISGRDLLARSSAEVVGGSLSDFAAVRKSYVSRLIRSYLNEYFGVRK